MLNAVTLPDWSIEIVCCSSVREKALEINLYNLYPLLCLCSNRSSLRQTQDFSARWNHTTTFHKDLHTQSRFHIPNLTVLFSAVTSKTCVSANNHHQTLAIALSLRQPRHHDANNRRHTPIFAQLLLFPSPSFRRFNVCHVHCHHGCIAFSRIIRRVRRRRFAVMEGMSVWAADFHVALRQRGVCGCGFWIEFGSSY
ncbi:hypothetical protein E2542_SST05111 [Spatholobus suberectus]|nr:hypothetical protein E2542_SST05111 [Spatholobus suberectus]